MSGFTYDSDYIRRAKGKLRIPSDDYDGEIKIFERPPKIILGDEIDKTISSKADDYIQRVKARMRARDDHVGETKVFERPPKIILDDEIGHTISKVERVIDPDGESSCLCSGCRLPIFSTPSISFSHGTDNHFMHEQCARLQPQLRRHELHPHHTLLLQNHLNHPPPPDSTPITCTNCNEVCGALFYQCPNHKCDFRLDVLCVLQIKIMHRSHHHTLMAIRQRESNVLTCSACDSKHDFPWSSSPEVTLSYLCNLCGFWIHPDCALLPNAIVHFKIHKDHSLFLTYNLPISEQHSKCRICSKVPKTTSGVYFCLKCSNYLVHFKCARSNPHTFKPVFIRDAKVSDLARLPLANENASLIPYLRQDISDKYQENLHPHPLVLNEIDEEGESLRVCNACIQYVSSPPFYSCTKCPDFILHSCCAHLPPYIRHPIHEHFLILFPKAPVSDTSAAAFSCKGCHLRCNGFAYSCRVCHDFSLDVVCAMIIPAITHESHKSTHILFISPNMQFGSHEKCNGCNSSLAGIYFKCSICPHFKLHARCAVLPNTIRHRYDQHPLRLTTTASTKSEAAAAADDDDNIDDDGGDGNAAAAAADDDDDDDMFCEVCEEHIKKEPGYYSCSECNQMFHIDCIPTVDRLSKIKLGSSIDIDCHGCPVSLVRQNDAVCSGRRCRMCGNRFCNDADLAYECSNCFYGMHENCVEKYLVEEE